MPTLSLKLALDLPMPCSESSSEVRSASASALFAAFQRLDLRRAVQLARRAVDCSTSKMPPQQPADCLISSTSLSISAHGFSDRGPRARNEMIEGCSGGSPPKRNVAYFMLDAFSSSDRFHFA